jgi:hypothetical protein
VCPLTPVNIPLYSLVYSLELLSVLVLDMIEILPPLGKYKYDTLRILPVKYYIDNSVRLRSCIRNINNRSLHCNACINYTYISITHF